MRIIRASALALATVLVTTLAVLVPSAAEARSYVSPDTSGDVVEVNFQYETTAVVPARTEGDIVSSGVVNGKRRIKMAMRYRELTMTGAGVVHVFRIGSLKRVRVVSLVARPGHWQGSALMEKDNGTNVTCRGMSWSIGYDDNLLRLSVPRRCLGKPKWVHVGMLEKHMEDPSNFLDDAQTNGYIGADPKWGPWVRR